MFISVRSWLVIFISPFRLVAPSGGVCLENHPDLVAHLAENSQLFLLDALRVRRIVETPVVAVHLAGEHRTRLVGVAANRNHGLDILLEKFVHVLAMVSGDVDADLGKHPDGQWMDMPCRLRSGAADVEEVARGVAQDSLCHVAAARVAGAQDKDDRAWTQAHRQRWLMPVRDRRSCG